MIAEIITTGTELLLGQIVNTNAAYLARQLNELGFDVLYQTTVGDNRGRMRQALETAVARADMVITTGGLGPTQGDITKEVTAQVAGVPLVLHEASLGKIKCYFQHRQTAMPENNVRQAMLPQGALVLENTCGTAPGVICAIENKVVINLPGPPREMQRMFTLAVRPYLQQRFGTQGAIVSRVLKSFGLGESALEEKIYDLVAAQGNPTLALLARQGEIHIRITARGETAAAAAQLITPLEESIRKRLGMHIFGDDKQTMAGVVGELLVSAGWTVALAESCTGGLATHKLTDVPGSSRYVSGAVVSYSNQVKAEQVGVPPAVLTQHGAVSEETALAMARGVRERLHTSLGVGITGIAGPDGGSDAKPVGLVYIAVDGPHGARCVAHHFNGERVVIKNLAALAALDLVRRYAAVQ